MIQMFSLDWASRTKKICSANFKLGELGSRSFLLLRDPYYAKRKKRNEITSCIKSHQRSFRRVNFTSEENFEQIVAPWIFSSIIHIAMY